MTIISKYFTFKSISCLILTIGLFLFLVTNIFSKESDMKDNRDKLTDLQRHVTLHNGTERPYQNEYWDNKEEGIYVDIISGEALFSSKDKFDSKTGWPSFTKPIYDNEIVKKIDKTLGMTRIEARSKTANSHLGHIFNDGPEERGGMRYCINSASLRFIHKKDLEKEGYGQYLSLFKKSKKEAKSKPKTIEKAVLAGGCFWGMEELLSKLDGVIDVKNGYTGGSIDNPTYDIVTTGLSGHAESVEITFDPTKISYEKILRFFFQIHDPTTLNKQGNDIGTQYRSAIFYQNNEQKEIAKNLIKKANRSKIFPGKITTKLVKASIFYEAEDYHQDYLEKNLGGYTCHKIREDWVF